MGRSVQGKWQGVRRLFRPNGGLAVLAASLGLLLASGWTASARSAPPRATSAGSPGMTPAQRTAARRHARLLYSRAQAACASRHDLGQMRKIIHEAALIKKYGGKARPQQEIYQCLRFRLDFHSRWTVKSKWTTSDGAKGSLDFKYSVTPHSLFLVPTSISPTEVVLAAQGQRSSHGRTLFPSPNLTFSGKGTLTDCGPYPCNGGPASCAKVTPNGTTGSQSYSGTVALDPSAKQPRSTLYVGFSINTPLEKYRIARWTGLNCAGTPSGGTRGDIAPAAAFPTFFLQHHAQFHDVSSQDCHRFVPRILGQGGEGLYGLRWHPNTSNIASGDWQLGGNYYLKAPASQPDDGCHNVPNWFGSSNPPKYETHEDTSVMVQHSPIEWKGAK